MISHTPVHPKVFISYSHDSPEHLERVRILCGQLRKGGVDCNIDQYEESPAEGWPRWTARRVREADFVLVVCTETYARRFDGEEAAGTGRGAKWEGAVITQELYDAEAHNTRFIPVLFESADAEYVPGVLRAATSYPLDTPDGFERLYRRLTGQPRATRPELGEIQPMPPMPTVQDFGLGAGEARAPRMDGDAPHGLGGGASGRSNEPTDGDRAGISGKWKKGYWWSHFVLPLLVALIGGGGFAIYKGWIEDVNPRPATKLSSDGKLEMRYDPTGRSVTFVFILTLDNSSGKDTDLLASPSASLGDAATEFTPINSIPFAADDFTITLGGQEADKTIVVDKGTAKVVRCIINQSLRGRSGEIFSKHEKMRLSVYFTGKDGRPLSHDFCFDNGKASETFISAACR